MTRPASRAPTSSRGEDRRVGEWRVILFFDGRLGDVLEHRRRRRTHGPRLSLGERAHADRPAEIGGETVRLRGAVVEVQAVPLDERRGIDGARRAPRDPVRDRGLLAADTRPCGSRAREPDAAVAAGCAQPYEKQEATTPLMETRRLAKIGACPRD